MRPCISWHLVAPVIRLFPGVTLPCLCVTIYPALAPLLFATKGALVQGCAVWALRELEFTLTPWGSTVILLALVCHDGTRMRWRYRARIIEPEDLAAWGTEHEVHGVGCVGEDGNVETSDGDGAQGVGREDRIYSHRYTPRELEARLQTWEILCRDFFPRYVNSDQSVVDLGAGEGFFIRNVKAGRRIAVDLSEQSIPLEGLGIQVIQAHATDFATKLGSPVDVVFMSNLLEHMPTKRVVLEVLEECHRALVPGGKILILQPNIRLVGAAYWDFIDHQVALTEHSLVEAMEISGFEVTEVIPRFLPYTSKSVLSNFSALVGIYLQVPLLWRIFGKQTFAVGLAR